MPIARTRSIALLGVEGHPVDIEAHVGGRGVAGLSLVGLPDTTLREARDRIRAAIVNSGEWWPEGHITVSLCPAGLPKRGSGFDLGIAAAILAADGQLPVDGLRDAVLLAELGLDGRARPVPGVLPAVLAGQRAGYSTFVVAGGSAAEARQVPGVKVVAVRSLAAMAAWLRGDPDADPLFTAEDAIDREEPPEAECGGGARRPDLSDVLGQAVARRALEIAAAGGHNLFLLGPPGTGKSLLAERLPTILPPLSEEESLEASAIHSVAGTLPPHRPLVTEPPFVDPHHSATRAAIVGGGTTVLRPGCASLAHRGVLFLDEAPEFDRGVLDSLRQPLESGQVTISRISATARFPARFQLVLAANPCPCAKPGPACSCTAATRHRYLGRLSGPLLDRIDLKVELHPVPRAELLADHPFAESSREVAARVAAARERSLARLAGTPWRTNAGIPGPELRRSFPLPPDARDLLSGAAERGVLSARGLDRVARLAWTLADLTGRPEPATEDVAYALALWTGTAL